MRIPLFYHVHWIQLSEDLHEEAIWFWAATNYLPIYIEKCSETTTHFSPNPDVAWVSITLWIRLICLRYCAPSALLYPLHLISLLVVVRERFYYRPSLRCQIYYYQSKIHHFDVCVYSVSLNIEIFIPKTP